MDCGCLRFMQVHNGSFVVNITFWFADHCQHAFVISALPAVKWKELCAILGSDYTWPISWFLAF